MDWLLGGLFDWIKQGLIDAIMANFANLYDTINSEVGNIAVNVGQTPAGWNPGVYSMVRTLSEIAVIPIAGMILTFVLCYELIQLIIEKNNMHEAVFCRGWYSPSNTKRHSQLICGKMNGLCQRR